MKGAWQIVRFNWPTYAVAGGIVFGSYVLLEYSTLPRIPLWAGLGITLYFCIASFIASYWVYDRSAWSGSSWLASILPPPYGRTWIIQTAFDPSHGRIAQQVGPCTVIDLYGTSGVGGASVVRACHSNTSDLSAVLDSLPEGEGSVESIIAPFTLHEIQTPVDRSTFFQALAKALTPHGRLLVVEHIRDRNNFLVFFLGFLHFLPAAEWRRCGQQAGLCLEKEDSLTPFVRLFVWSKP